MCQGATARGGGVRGPARGVREGRPGTRRPGRLLQPSAPFPPRRPPPRRADPLPHHGSGHGVDQAFVGQHGSHGHGSAGRRQPARTPTDSGERRRLGLPGASVTWSPRPFQKYFRGAGCIRMRSAALAGYMGGATRNALSAHWSSAAGHAHRRVLRSRGRFPRVLRPSPTCQFPCN